MPKNTCFLPLKGGKAIKRVTILGQESWNDEIDEQEDEMRYLMRESTVKRSHDQKGQGFWETSGEAK